MARPWFIAVAGIMGSGKTTVARGLADKLGWRYLPESRRATLFLGDLFRNPSRWAFEIQTAFLVNKALEIEDALSKATGIVLDRTIFEDVQVFAEYFRRNGDIDRRSYATYRDLADHFFREIPVPDLVILCQCSTGDAKKRIEIRKENQLPLYPPNHLDRIAEMYFEWSQSYDQSDIYTLDTSRIDMRRQKNVDGVAKEILEILARGGINASQGDLFVAQTDPAGHLRKPFDPLRVTGQRFRETRRAPKITGETPPVTRYPSAYLAAPFSGYSTPVGGGDDLFGLQESHTVLKEGEYRNFLLSIERTFRRIGIITLIPHRDINRWGERILTPNDVVRLCSEYVGATDLFVGVLGQSHGSHYEFGLARGLGKPALLLQVAEIPESFIASGAAAGMKNSLVVRVAYAKDVEKVILHPDTLRFLRRFIPIPEGVTT